jgi:hypothetical protein
LRPAASAIDTEGVEVPLDSDDEPSGDLLPAQVRSGAPVVASAGDVSPHAGRFGFAMGALLAVAAAGVVLAALVIAHRNDTDPVPVNTWSTWAPVKGDGDGPTQIARHIGPEYRLPSGRQLVYIKASSLAVDGVKLDVATVGSTKKSAIKVHGGDKTVMYRLCGLNPACSIPGTPSSARHFLLQREALELALYTFQFTNADGVAVLFPPVFTVKKNTKLTAAQAAAALAKAKTAQVAAYFQRKDLSPRLDQPVDATLTPTTPTVATATRSPDALTVKAATDSSLYTFSLTSGNTDDTGYLVLQK